MRIEINKKDIIWSYASVVVSMLTNLVILPFVLKYLDNESIGLYYVFSNLSTIGALFDFGFASSFARNLSYCWSGVGSLSEVGTKEYLSRDEVDFCLMKKILLASKLIYAIISVIVLLLSLTVGTWYVLNISENISGSLIILAWIIYAFAIFFNLYFGYYASYLRGVGAIESVSKITTLSRLLQIVSAIMLLVGGYGLIGVGIAYLLYGFSFRIACKVSFYRFENIGIELEKVKLKIKLETLLPIIKAVWDTSWKEGVVSLSNYVVTQAGTIICSLYYSLYETGVYSLAVQLVTAISSIASTMYIAYQPALQSAYAKKDREGQKKNLSISVVSFVVIFNIGMIGLVTVGIPFIGHIKSSYVLPISLVLAVGLYQFMIQFRNCYTTFFSSTNRLIYMPSFVISAIISIVLSIAFSEAFNIGVWGLILAQIISQLVFNFWYWPLKAHKELELDIPEMVRLTIESYKALLLKNN